MKARVLHYVSKMNRGGQETFIMNVFRNIDTEQIKFDFLCTETGEGDYDTEIKRLGGKIYNLPPVGKNHFKMFALLLSLWKKLRKLSQNHDIFEIHTQHAMDAFFSSFVAKRAGFKVVIVHSHNSSTMYHPKLHHIFKPFLKMLSIKRFACSNGAGKWMYGKSNFSVINNGIQVSDFLYSPEIRKQVRQKFNWTNQIVVGHVGRFNDQKNHNYLIDIFNAFHKIHKNSRLVLVGVGENLNIIKKKVDDYQLGKYVDFLGNRSDVNELYQGMDLFLFPSFFEGLPVVLIESQTSSLPCLVSDSVTGEVKITPKLYFYSLGKGPSEWAKKLDSLAKNSKRKNEINLIKKNGYDIRDVAKKLEKLYFQYAGEIK